VQYITSPRAAELAMATFMRVSLNYQDARVTPVGADGGIDVSSSSALAQVKQEAFQTGRPALQRLVGARGTETALDLLFFSAVGFTRHAKEYADEVDIAIFVYDVVGKVEPANPRI
jgi:hypothetical protein